MSATLLSKILNYEQKVFHEYLDSRKKMLGFLHEIEINKLDESQLLIFIENLKNVIDPIKTSMSSINDLVSFKNNNGVNENEFVLFYLLFGNLFFGDSSGSDSNDEILSVESPESDSDPDSESVL